MKFINIMAVLAAVAILTTACVTDPEERKKQSREAYPNQEWRRPPAHWAPP